MQVVAAIKIVPDDQDIQVAADRSLDFSKARPVVSEYDLNALEAAAQLAAACVEEGLLVLTAGPALRFLPPLTITQAEMDKGLEILEKTLKEV